MGLCFVVPEQTRLELSGGDWILVKKRLTHGEQSDLFARLYVAGADGRFHAHPIKSNIVTVSAYLLDWSNLQNPIRGADAETIEATLRGLDPESFAEIREAITGHQQHQEQVRETEKNGKDGGKGLPGISPSPDGVTGDTNGSVN